MINEFLNGLGDIIKEPLILAVTLHFHLMKILPPSYQVTLGRLVQNQLEDYPVAPYTS